MRNCIIILIICFSYIKLFSQNDYLNNQKYWKLRYKLKEFHTRVGEGYGFSQIADKVIFNNYFDEKYRTSISFADELIYQGWYIAVLATEIHLLEKYNLPFENTLKELYFALKAVERLDNNAEDLSQNCLCYSFDHSSNEYISNHIPWLSNHTNPNGFLIRSDVPPKFYEKFNNYYDKQFTGCAQDLDRYGDENDQNSCQEMSQDQLYHLNIGLSFVALCVSNDLSYNGENLIDLNSSIAFRSFSQFNYNTFLGNPLFSIYNPATGEKVEDGSDAFYYIYPFVETIRNILYLGNTNHSQTLLNQLDLIYLYQIINLNTYNSSKLLWQASFQTNALTLFYSALDVFSTENDFWSMNLVNGALSDKMSQMKLSYFGSSNNKRKEIYAMMNQALYPNLININYWSINSKRELLNKMCCETGPFLIHTDDFNYSLCEDWYNPNIFVTESVTNNPTIISDYWFRDGYFSGLDYMLLHNLFHLVHPTDLESQFENHEEVTIIKSYPTNTNVYQGYLYGLYHPDTPVLGNDEMPHVIRAFKSVKISDEYAVNIWNSNNSIGKGSGNVRIEVGEIFSTDGAIFTVDEGATFSISEAKPIVCDDIYGYVQQQRQSNLKPELMSEVNNNSRSSRNVPPIFDKLISKQTNNQTSFFSIYPNPASNTLTLFNSLFDSETIQLSIFSNDGKLVYNDKRNFINSTSIDILTLQAGFYILKTEQIDGKSETFKFVKQ